MTTRRKTGLQFVAGMLLLGQGATIHAQEPLGIKLGPGWRLYPALEMRTLYDTNFFFTADDEIDAFGLLLRPGVSVVREGRRSKFEGGLRAEVGRYDTSSDDNYTDSDGFARFNYVASKRQRLRAGVERNYGHDPFGLLRTELPPGQSPLDIDRNLDEYHEDMLDAGYRFGTPGARINLDYAFNARDKEYDTNQDLGARFLDYSMTSHQGTLTYNYSPKTAVLLRTQWLGIDYDRRPSGQPTRDFQQVRYLAGASYQPSGKLYLQALAGRIEHDPDASQRKNFSQFDWDVQATWQPSRRTTLTLNTGREVRPSFLLAADFINVEQYTLSWSQTWTGRVSTQLTYIDATRSFEGVARQDDFRRANLDVNWLWTRDFALVGSLAYLEVNSNSTARDFQKQVLSLGFRYQP